MPVFDCPVRAAIHNAGLLPRADVERQLEILREHLDHLLSGASTAENSWRSMADVVNMTETMSAMRIGAGDDAKRIISGAQRALLDARAAAERRSTWAMRSDEREALKEALEWLLSLHSIQLKAISIKEYSKAFTRTRARMSAERKRGGGVRVVGDL